MNAVDIETRLREAVEALPQGLREHTLRVEAEATRLAGLHHVDEKRARLAALGHDLVRHKTGPELLALATRYDIVPDAVERAEPVLIHGPIATRILEREYAFADADILAGIDCHTTARPGMAPVEQVLFVADKIEPHKLNRFPEYEEVYDLSLRDLSAGVLKFLDIQLRFASERGWLVPQKLVDARNALIMERGGFPSRHEPKD